MHNEPAFSSFPELEEHLQALGLFRIRPELGQMRTVLSALDSTAFLGSAVQIAGTNGKGSTSSMLASLAKAQGLRVGLFTSPHFVSFRERIRINGRLVADTVLLRHANELMAAGGGKLTYFEFVTLLAALVFSAAKVDLAILETGLGGTWDAVTALPADLVVFTPIDRDHCSLLGNSLGAIARDKAGAMRPGKTVFTVRQAPEAAHELVLAARHKGCTLYEAGGLQSLPEPLRTEEVPMRLGGLHQRDNAALALAAWRHLAREKGWESRLELELSGLEKAFIPGRLQYIPPRENREHPALLLDGAHNAHAMAMLGAELAREKTAPAAVIFSCLEDKTPETLIAHLRILATGPIFVPPISHNPRALDPQTLAKLIGIAAVPVENMACALESATRFMTARMPDLAAAAPQRYPVLLCGSLYMLGDFFSLYPEYLDPFPDNETKQYSPNLSGKDAV